MAGMLLGSSVGKVEALSSHLCANSTILDLQNQPSESRISQVEVPHILESTLIDLSSSTGICSSNRTTERVSTESGTWHLVDYSKGILQ
jgi:hypothetical protein